MPLEKAKNPISAIEELKLFSPGSDGMDLPSPAGGHSPASFFSGVTQR